MLHSLRTMYRGTLCGAVASIALVWVAGTVVGCGGGDDDDDDVTTPDAAPPDADPNAVIIPPTTKVLDDETAALLTAVDADGTLTFSASTSALDDLAAGDVIVVPITDLTPDGLLRRVDRVDRGSEVVVATSFASLTDAIEQAEFAVPDDLTDLEIDEVTPLHDGITLVTDPSEPLFRSGERFGLRKLVFNFNDSLLAGFRLKGSLELSLTPTFRVKIRRFKLVEATATATASEEARLRLVGEAAVSGDIEKQIAEIKFKPVIVWVGYVPVYVRPVIELTLGGEASVSASFTTGVEQSLSYTAGVQYANGAWGVVNDLTKMFSYTPPSVDASLEAKGALTPRLVFYVYGVAGPFLGAEAYLKFTADLNADPWCDLVAGLGGEVGVTGDLYGVDLGEYKAELFNLETSLFTCGKPYMNVTGPDDLSASGPEGGPFSPSATTYAVAAKDGTVSWTASVDVPWLSLSATSGTASEGSPASVNVSITDAANDLPVGLHRGAITFTNATNNEGSTVRYVYVDVREPAMTVTPGPDTYLLSRAPEGGDFSGLSVSFSVDADIGTIDFSASSDADWLTVSPTSGTVTAGTPITVTATVDASRAASLPARTHLAHVTFTNETNGAGNTSRLVAIQPRMNVAGTIPTMTMDEGGSYDGTHPLTVTAVNDDIPWTADASAAWLAVTPATGTAAPGSASTVTVAVDNAVAGGLSTGVYTADVAIANTASGPFSDVARRKATLVVRDSTPPGDPVTWLGTLPGHSSSIALAVADGGNAVVGLSGTPASGRAFRWTRTDGMTDLGVLPTGTRSQANGVSGDGTIVVGTADITIGTSSFTRPFVWTADTGMVDLMGTPAQCSTEGEALAISHDGTTIVGWREVMGTSDCERHAFRWRDGAFEDLGTLGGDFTYAYAVSADGSVVVGSSFDPMGVEHAVKWTTGSAPQDLGAAGLMAARAVGVSADGSVIVGTGSPSEGAGQGTLLRWTTSGGSQIDNTGRAWSEASGVSGDGNTIVGWSAREGEFFGRAIRWTQASGIVELNSLFLVAPDFLYQAKAITADGRYIVGEGDHDGVRQAYLFDSLATP
ncbi:MAG: hypothetical protein D6689_11620 [Deltaproteobacteria bacterium]|nr:MAG: hypothetical protein D6689_11620 [Deltaproteobacteria bacterium]